MTKHPFKHIAPKREKDGQLSLVPLSDDFFVPRHFVASEDSLSLEIEVDADGTPHCRGLQVRAPCGDVTGETLRQIPVGRLTRQATASAARQYEPIEEGGEPVFRLFGTSQSEHATFYERFTKDARRPHRGSPITNENLAQVADLYRAALEHGDPPTQTVADELGVPRSTAARWVAKARERKLLGPALRGRGGEGGTAK